MDSLNQASNHHWYQHHRTAIINLVKISVSIGQKMPVSSTPFIHCNHDYFWIMFHKKVLKQMFDWPLKDFQYKKIFCVMPGTRNKLLNIEGTTCVGKQAQVQPIHALYTKRLQYMISRWYFDLGLNRRYHLNETEKKLLTTSTVAQDNY